MSQRPATVDVYRWSCPVCDETGIRMVDGAAGGASAVDTLRNHVAFTAGGGHGPAGELPDGCDADVLAEHVE